MIRCFKIFGISYLTPNNEWNLCITTTIKKGFLMRITWSFWSFIHTGRFPLAANRCRSCLLVFVALSRSSNGLERSLTNWNYLQHQSYIRLSMSHHLKLFMGSKLSPQPSLLSIWVFLILLFKLNWLQEFIRDSMRSLFIGKVFLILMLIGNLWCSILSSLCAYGQAPIQGEKWC